MTRRNVVTRLAPSEAAASSTSASSSSSTGWTVRTTNGSGHEGQRQEHGDAGVAARATPIGLFGP